MEDKDLEEYKQKISNMSYYEKKLRDIYLRKLAIGEIQGPPVGYASIDKPWLKHYEEKALDYEIPECGVYEYMQQECEKYSENVCMELGSGKSALKITYKKLFKMVEKVAKALKQMGVQKGDVVSVCMPNTPEVAYIFYALNKIGAVANMLDPRTNPSNLQSSLKDSNSKLLLTLDLFSPVFEGIIDGTNIENVVTVSAIASVPAIIRPLLYIKDESLRPKLTFDKRFMSYDKFLRLGNRYHGETLEKVDCNADSVIAYTGGTTGISKGVIASNRNLNAMIVENEKMGYDVKPGDRCLNIAPPWTYYGLSNCLNAYTHLGATSLMIPKFDPNNLGALIAEYLPNHIITVPSTLISVMNDETLDGMDLSFIKTIIVGADKLDPTFEQKFNDWLAKHNSKCKITKGYGMTEVTAAASYSRADINTPGNVGIPYIAENISVFDPETGMELPTGSTGEIAIVGPKNMKGYYGENADKTEEVLKEHSDGTVWAHTSDLGHIDKDGFLVVDGRIKRMFTKAGFKIFAPEIEKHIYEHPAVLQCAVIPVPSDEFGCQAKAFIVLKDEYKSSQEEVQKQIIELLKTTVFDYEIPDYYEFRDSLPLTGMNKINFVELEEEEKEKATSKGKVK